MRFYVIPTFDATTFPNEFYPKVEPISRSTLRGGCRKQSPPRKITPSQPHALETYCLDMTAAKQRMPTSAGDGAPIGVFTPHLSPPILPDADQSDNVEIPDSRFFFGIRMRSLQPSGATKKLPLLVTDVGTACFWGIEVIGEKIGDVGRTGCRKGSLEG